MPKMIHIGRADGSHYYYKEVFLLPAVCRCRTHRRADGLLRKALLPNREEGCFLSSFSFSLFLGSLREWRSAQTETCDAHVPTSLKPTTVDLGHFRGIYPRDGHDARRTRPEIARVISMRGTRGAASGRSGLDFREISLARRHVT